MKNFTKKSMLCIALATVGSSTTPSSNITKIFKNIGIGVGIGAGMCLMQSLLKRIYPAAPVQLKVVIPPVTINVPDEYRENTSMIENAYKANARVLEKRKANEARKIQAAACATARANNPDAALVFSRNNFKVAFAAESRRAKTAQTPEERSREQYRRDAILAGVNPDAAEADRARMAEVD